ncbi:hypothetical protein FIBSPDRAFT_851995 [Athelia psychrophila]|uniref:Carbohydrate-binding module family 19 domain-containing protein n=1 Tax=Athelia psychrophila TaxID=1759441 RepID=A0A166S8T0_9AGAM|nr:hypothetical protein FIBSPDRAFT_851995 [Fibularhizoctonia sp. CBS 109695]
MHFFVAAFAAALAFAASASAAAVPTLTAPAPTGSAIICPDYKIGSCPCGTTLVYLPPCYNGNCIPGTETSSSSIPCSSLTF